jgi:hypothetical protein
VKSIAIDFVQDGRRLPVDHNHTRKEDNPGSNLFSETKENIFSSKKWHYLLMKENAKKIQMEG